MSTASLALSRPATICQLVIVGTIQVLRDRLALARKKRTYSIILHGPIKRGLLKLSVLPLPIFAIMFELNVLNVIFPHSIGTTFEANRLPILAGLLAASLFFYWQLFHRSLKISRDRFNFGLGHSYPASSLAVADFAQEGTELEPVLNLQFGSGDEKKIEKVRLACLVAEQRQHLLEAIDQFAPQAKLASGVRAKLSASKFLAAPANFKGEALLRYNSRPVIDQLIAMFSTYEKYFWYAWKASSVSISILLAVLAFLMYASLRPAPHLLFSREGSLFISAMFRYLAQFAASTFEVARYGASNQAGLVASAVLAITLTLSALYLRRPNRLSVNKEGLQLQMTAAGITHTIESFKWEDIDGVNLRQKEGAHSAAEGNLEFLTRSGKRHIINLRSLEDSSQRWILAQAIEKYLPHVQIDARAMTTLKPPVESSFTEIWLTGLNTAPHSQSLVPLIQGDQVGHGREKQYTIDAVHTIGGQSTVYTAAQSDLIIKETIIPVFSDSARTAEHVLKFESEGALLQSLHHEGLVEIVESFVEGSRGFIVMKKVDGDTLQNIVNKDGALPVDKVIDLARQMCAILQYLHNSRPALIHRDFTPDNLMLDKSGKLILIDFGVAQNQSDHRTATVVGKHAYMPPEQFRGQASAKSDLYALGASIYYLLTANEPTPLTKLKLDQIIFGSREKEMALAEKLTSLISSLTDFDEKNRPENAEAVLAQLNTMQFGEDATSEQSHTIKFDTAVKELIE
jgi:tRNA A-37 threonylcarbamoyl transferase component Bud32